MPFIGGHWWVIVLVFLLVLILWGPGKLPLVGGGLGRMIRDFRKAVTDKPDTPKEPAADVDASASSAKSSGDKIIR